VTDFSARTLVSSHPLSGPLPLSSSSNTPNTVRPPGAQTRRCPVACFRQFTRDASFDPAGESASALRALPHRPLLPAPYLLSCCSEIPILSYCYSHFPCAGRAAVCKQLVVRPASSAAQLVALRRSAHIESSRTTSATPLTPVSRARNRRSHDPTSSVNPTCSQGYRHSTVLWQKVSSAVIP
jgi:hypothetical protein